MKIKILVIVFISFIAIILLLQNFHTEEENVLLTKQPQTVEEFNITHKEDNALKWDLTSKRAIIAENETTILLNEKITIKILHLMATFYLKTTLKSWLKTILLVYLKLRLITIN